jgi:hypothetical protein
MRAIRRKDRRQSPHNPLAGQSASPNGCAEEGWFDWAMMG